MVLTLTLPEPGKKKRIKDLVIDILSFEWPLSLSQIYNRIKKNYAYSSTCQAVYKAISELVSAEVLIKKEKLYCVNSQWISSLKNFSHSLEQNYHGNEKLPLIEGVARTKTENNVTILTFNSILEMDKTWVKIKKEYYENLQDKGDVTFWEGNHCWWLLVYPDVEFEEMEMVKNKKVKDFVFLHNNKKLDLFSNRFYEKAGVGFKAIDDPVEYDMTVFGDTIMQVTLPKELRDKIDEFYKKASSPSDVDIHSLLSDVLTKKSKIELVLTKNREIANQLKKKILHDFNQKV
jgi:hypothetical protein